MANKNNSQKSKKNVASEKNLKGTGFQKTSFGKEEGRKDIDVRESK